MLELLLGYAASEMLDDGVPRSRMSSAYKKGFEDAKKQILEFIQGKEGQSAEWQAYRDEQAAEKNWEPTIDVVMGASFRQPKRDDYKVCHFCGSSRCHTWEGDRYPPWGRHEVTYRCTVCGAKYIEKAFKREGHGYWQGVVNQMLVGPSGPEYEAHRAKLLAEQAAKQEAEEQKKSEKPKSWFERLAGKK